MSRCSKTAAILLLLAWGFGPVAGAHEMGAMKVVAFFTADGQYRIDLTIDAEHSPLVPSAKDVQVFFDGRPATVTEDATAAADAAGSVQRHCRLTGTIPAGARTFSFAHQSVEGTYLMGTQHEGDPEVAWQWLDGTAQSEAIPLRFAPPPPTRGQVFRDYLVLGFTHIVPKGLDHILFVLGLCLLSPRRKAILLQITAFTVAHSLTLAMSIYGMVYLSPRLVEPMIALSIVYVAVENLVHREAGPSRVAVVFGFGLLHGLGFAGVLNELGLPPSEFLTALAAFNIGVEAGQLTVVAAAFLSVGLLFGNKTWYWARIAAPASLLIAAVGLFWAVQRVGLI